MNENRNLKFIWFGGPSSNIGIRINEISKRIVKENIFPTIIIHNKLDKNKIDLSYLTRLSPIVKIYTPILKEFRHKAINYLRDIIIKILFFFQLMPFLPLKIKEIIRNERDIKFIYATGPPFYIHIFGALLKKKYNIPLVIEYTDPFSFNPYREKKYLWIERKIDRIIEKKIIKSASIIVSLSKFLNMQLKENFPFISEKPIISIEDGLNIYNGQCAERNSQKIVLIFAGKLYGRRNINPFLKILSDLNKERLFEDISFTLKIYGLYPEEKLKRVINTLDIKQIVELKGFIPRSEVLKKIAQSDLALHVGEDINYPTIAFKVYEYISCGKKVVFLSPKNTYRAQFIEDNELGFIIPLNDLKQGKEIFKDIIISIKNNKFNCTIDKNKILKFSWDNIAKKFEENVIKYFTA